MSVAEVKQIVLAYGAHLRRENFSLSSVYLFGSYANGKAGEHSDIDLAVIGKSRKKYWDIITLLNDATLDVDVRIEPHYFRDSDFGENAGALANEVLRTGVKIMG
jgi:predicted nucleotidyltransferase